MLPATWECEARRTQILGYPGQPQSLSQSKRYKWVEIELSVKDLGSSPGYPQPDLSEPFN